MIEKKQSWTESLLVYKDVRMLRILLLGAISGFPWVLIASSLSLWLKEEGLSRSTIGWAGLIFGVYAFNYLWAPIIDRIQIPILTKRLGHRRGWIVLMQIAILLSLIVWSFINPTQNLALLIGVGLIIAIASATQDITVDALRIEQIGEHEGKSMQAGAAMAVVGWWTGYKLGGVVALTSAEDSIAYLVNVSSRADELFPGSSVVIRTANAKTDGRVVAISGASSNEVTLTVEEDLGEHLDGGDISIDDTAMDTFIRDLLARECGISRKGDKDKKPTKKGLLLDFASNVLNNQYYIVHKKAYQLFCLCFYFLGNNQIQFFQLYHYFLL